MPKAFKFVFLLLINGISVAPLYAQLTGKIIDSATHNPINGIRVSVSSGNTVSITNESGHFSIKKNLTVKDSIHFSGIGYQALDIPFSEFKNGEILKLSPRVTTLSDVVITSGQNNPYKVISESDIKMRGVSNSQEVLRIVPGLFIGQHQGGGKAEQIFLRGFDNDHGTDIRLDVDGMPINMVSQAHGQGYADSHFIIPETIVGTDYKKGSYDASKGDLAVTGSVEFHTADAISENQLKAEAGQFDTYRILGIFNILGDRARLNGRSWYVASEYRFSNSYFDDPQHFKRFNFFTKYHGKLSDNSTLSLSASTFYSSWYASGQIPESAVDKKQIGFYGAIDPNEGGVTSRTNLNAQFLTNLGNHDLIKNQLYYSRYKFDLHTNFTFYLVDTTNGDEIRQREKRNLFGYNGVYLHDGYLGNVKATSEVGINSRLDLTGNSELSHTVNRYTLISPIKLGDITELNLGVYLNETFHFNSRLSLGLGLRYDRFYYRYNNKYGGDSTLNGLGLYTANNQIISPKINLYYQVSDKAQIYLFGGKGFNSNDARAVVAANGLPTLPAAYNADLGTIFKPAKTVVINAALWYNYLQKEYVYGGDGGTVDFSGRTRRIGFDLSGRYQPIPSLYIDGDLNYAHGRSLDDPAGSNYIPLAPVWSSTGGVTFQSKNGINASLRYRYLGDRAANEDYSLKAEGYLINDFVLNYKKNKYEIGMTINNLFNVKWKETQFETVTRLKNEAPIDGIAFTPGTKFGALFHISYFFR